MIYLNVTLTLIFLALAWIGMYLRAINLSHVKFMVFLSEINAQWWRVKSGEKSTPQTLRMKN